jgi:hypothetical protein
MKTEQEQQEFQQKQKLIAQMHSNLVDSIGVPKNDEEHQLIKASEEQMHKAMQDLVFKYIGPEFHQMMQEKDSNQ